MDPVYAKTIGVDVDNLLVSQPDYGEQALEIAEMLVRSGALDIVAIDSVAALTPKAEIEGEMGDSFVGLQARLMSQALRKLAGTPQPLRHHLRASPTSCARRSASCSATPRRRRAARPSSSTPPSASTSAASRPSRTAPRPSATACGSRSPRTRWRRPSSWPSSTSCTGRASLARARCSTSGSSTTSCRRAAPSSATTTSASGRGGRTRGCSSGRIPTSPTSSRPRSARRPACRRRPREQAPSKPDAVTVPPGVDPVTGEVR